MRTPRTVRVRILAKVTKERILKYLCILKIKKGKRVIRKPTKLIKVNGKGDSISKKVKV